MKYIVFNFIFCIGATSSICAQTVQIFYENHEGVYIIYANSNEIYPISIYLDFDLTYLKFSKGNQKIFVVPPKYSRFRIGELTPIYNSSPQLSYKYKTALGDVTQKKFDTSYVYDLPYKKGNSYKVIHGYSGILSLLSQDGVDFSMPEGTEIVAAREGIVAQIQEKNTQSCPQKECENYNNFIIVMHPDKSFAYYGNIKYNGAKCKIGDKIKKGDVIAESGSVGISTVPHLYFTCFLGDFEKWRTFGTKFKVDNGDNVDRLQEGKEYSRNY